MMERKKIVWKRKYCHPQPVVSHHADRLITTHKIQNLLMRNLKKMKIDNGLNDILKFVSFSSFKN